MDWETVKQFVIDYGYFAVALGTLVDQSGLQSFVVAGGALALLEPDFSLAGVIVAGTCGSVASDMIMWALGRWRANWLDRIVRSDKGRMRLQVLEAGMKRHVFALLAIGRLLPWIGRFVPAAAGLRRVPFLKALAFTTIGALGISAGFALLGYYAAESISWLEEYALWIWLGALAVSFPVASLLVRRFDKIVMKKLEAEKPEREL